MKKLIIFLVLFFSLNVNAQIVYPEYSGHKALDLSNTFDSKYISKLENELDNSKNDIRIVFINAYGKINIGIYAAKLFDKWQMSDNSVLAVIDPNNDIKGFGIGKNVRDNLRKKLKINNAEGNEENLGNDIDYKNLVDSINNKFYFDNQIETSKKKENNSSNQKEAINTVGGSSNTTNNNDRNINFDNSNLFKYSILAIILAIISYLSFFLYKKKEREDKEIEEKNNLTFEIDIKLQEITNLIDEINKLLDLSKNYNNKTEEYLNGEIEKLKNFLVILEEKYNSLSEKAENISNCDFDDIYKLIEDINLLEIDINNIISFIKEKLKTINKIVKNSFQNISDVRIYLETNSRLVDENSKLYNLELNFIKESLDRINNEIFDIDIDNIKKDPILFRDKITDIENILIEIKKEMDIIPHLYNQINIQLNNIFKQKELENNNEINLLKEDALNSLNEGNLKKSSEIIEKIFKILNEEN